MVQSVRDEGSPEALSERTSLRQRRELAYDTTEYGPAIRKAPVKAADVDGTPVDDIEIPFQHPMAMLSATLKRCPSFRMFFGRLLTTVGIMLRIHIYNDEVAPGQALKQLA